MSFARFRRRLLDLEPRLGRRRSWVLLETLDSTNALARRVASAYEGNGGRGRRGRRPPPTAFLAFHQSQGRGRGGNSWVSPAGQGVYASLLIPEVSEARLHSLPLLVAVGLARGVEPLVESSVGLRWPNDLVVGEGGGRKLGGILIESLARPGEAPMAIVGFGVNYRGSGGGSMVPGATAICLERSSPEVRGDAEGLAELAARLVEAVDLEMSRLDDEPYAAESYAAASVHRAGEALSCRTGNGTVEGRFRGFDERGFLRLETPAGERLLAAGELVGTGLESSDEEERR